MARLRRLATIGLATWLLSYGVTLASAAVSLAAPSVSACTCVHTPGVPCPMHSRTVCRWRSAATPLGSSFAFVFGANLNCTGAALARPAFTATHVSATAAAGLDRPVPTSPPPRA